MRRYGFKRKVIRHLAGGYTVAIPPEIVACLNNPEHIKFVIGNHGRGLVKIEAS